MDLKRSSNEYSNLFSFTIYSSGRGAASSAKKHKPYNSVSMRDYYEQPAYSPSIPKTTPYLYSGATKGSVNPSPVSGKFSEDRQDTEKLQDALVSAGVDIKEEEHNMSRSYDYGFGSNTLSFEEDRTKITDFLNPIPLNDLIYRIAISNSLKTIDPEVAPLLALSLRNRMAGLLSDMIILSKHRTTSPPINKKIIDNVGKILEEINNKEKDMEEKRRAQLLSKRLEEKNKIDKQSSLSGNPDDMDKKRKKKETGINSASKSLSEDTQKRNTDTTAAIMMGSGPNGPGGKKYSWMTSIPSLSLGYTTKTHRITENSSPTNPKTISIEPAQEVGIITIRDALNVLEMDKEGAGEVFGRGARALSRGYIRLRD
ncbi:uncharacterized protein T551_01025 [Pneumocystis jirovecii RU7]|uniref:Transcription initiation factor TFIID subunit 4 n=1 Tax=Pneumocystis jirovecii (strain RU7) TaxID=1408657 RepID=A0A0W4ZTW0_PNEJ7|nr:uncharacterized protein T551_01025 [Pneumocystis jirovecii RU7]KTW31764.1 hypothetical protein T551_01025 [Pneumocystis jirovecii RU7]